MNIAVISVTENGRILSRRIAAFLGGPHIVGRFCFRTHYDTDSERFDDIHLLTQKIFSKYDALIFVCACGIAVRAAAPHIYSKLSDPAVIVVDDTGKFVIPVLSGHLGGANRLSEIVASEIGAVPVITTATDIGGKFSPDSFAKANGLIISDMSAAKEIASAVLDGETAGLFSEYPCSNIPGELSAGAGFRTGICISPDRSKKPFPVTLNLVPRNIIVGIGCKRGTSCGRIDAHVMHCLETAGIDADRICAAATIDIKSDETGLLEFCRNRSVRLLTFSSGELMQARGSFSHSDFVQKNTGADNVCERSAVCAGGRLFFPKTAGNGVTAALAELPVTIDFERKIL